MNAIIKKLLLIVLLLGAPLVASALDYTLLEPIPGFLPAEAPETLEEYLVGLFRFAIGIAGVLAVIRITWCGLSLMMSVNPSAREDAKACIKLAIFGLLLALGAFLIINSVRVGKIGGVAVENPFELPETGTENAPVGNAPAVGVPGSPVCTVVSANINLLEGQQTNISANCAPEATGYIWIPSLGSPAISGAGGVITFGSAGIYTYRVQGQNAVGIGSPSAMITITVAMNPVSICPEKAPEEVVGPIACSQILTLRDWTAIGVGSREENIVLGNGRATAITFTSGPVGAYGHFKTEAIVDPDTLLPININADKFVNISKAQCDFRYGNIEANSCAISGKNITLRFQSGMGRPPTGISGCVLEPNTAYVINVRNEEAGGPLSNRNIDTCPTLQICEFRASITQTDGAQFIPPERVQCEAPAPIPKVPPIFEITGPIEGAEISSGVFSVAYNAQDVQGLSSIHLSVLSVESGATLETIIACTMTGSAAVFDENTGALIVPAVPACGNVVNTVALFNIPTVQGNYRIEGRACNTGGQCIRKNVTVGLHPVCVDAPGVQCFAFPVNPPSAFGTNLCTPAYGSDRNISKDMTHVYRFRLPPGTSGRIVLANYPMWNCDEFSSPPFPNWCTETSLLQETWNVGGCSYNRDSFVAGEISLFASISSSPQDFSATSNTSEINGGNAIGKCGTMDSFGVGYFETIVKSSGVAGPGECVIRPDVDYYLNIRSIYKFVNHRKNWDNDVYGVVFSLLP